MYYKVTSEGFVIDVLERLNYVRFTDRGTVLWKEKNHAGGVISSDGSTVWHIPELGELPDFMRDDYKSAALVEITEEEYLELQKQLEVEHPVDIVPEQEEIEEEKPEPVMSATEMRVLITHLQEEVERLKENNTFLEDCLLEMSEEVYG